MYSMKYFGFSKTASHTIICPKCNWVITEGEPGCLSCKDFFDLKNGALLEVEKREEVKQQKAEEEKCINPKVLYT
jgi:hypothetical protein